MELAEVIRTWIREQRISQNEFARRVGADSALVSRWLNGTHGARPGRDYCERIARVTGRPVAEILELAGHELDGPTPSTGEDSSRRRVAEYISEVAKRCISRTSPEQIPEVLPKWQELVSFYWKATEPAAQRVDVERDPEEHAGNDQGRDNSQQSVLDRVFLAQLPANERRHFTRRETEVERESQAVPA